jgi:hypothetical protein
MIGNLHALCRARCQTFQTRHRHTPPNNVPGRGLDTASLARRPLCTPPPTLLEVAPALTEAPRAREVRKEVMSDPAGLPLHGPYALHLGAAAALSARVAPRPC